jgi:stage V sporulation protein S
MPTLRVSAQSRPNAVAGAIAALLRLDGVVEMQAIGPHAVNQAVKSLAIARSYLEQDALDLVVAPGFVKLELHDEERTAIRFDVRAVTREHAEAEPPGGVDGEAEPEVEAPLDEA